MAASFKLPRFQDRLAAGPVGFYGEVAVRLGFYKPGERPQIYDPVWNATRVPEAIICHEDVHQQLTINTQHGVLTQLLAKLSRDGKAQDSFRCCLTEQWSVQELTATYNELSFILQFKPEHFDATVSGLPTSVLDQPPYRELFQAARQVLPLAEADRQEDHLARSNLFAALAACSLQTGCLLEFAKAGFDDVRFAAYLRRESPHRRFEQIIAALGADTVLALAHDAADRLRASSVNARGLKQMMSSYMDDIRGQVREPWIEDQATLPSQAKTATAALPNIRARGRHGSSIEGR